MPNVFGNFRFELDWVWVRIKLYEFRMLFDSFNGFR